jgi:hypothetical protein
MQLPCVHRGWPKVYRQASQAGRLAGAMTAFAPVYGSTRNAGDGRRWREAMGIDWMTRAELTEAIPPDYTEFLGRQLINWLSV